MHYDLNLRAHVENDLLTLEEGYRELMQRREQIERALEQQTGGINYAKRLLEKIDAEAAEKKDAGTTIVDGVPAESEVVNPRERNWINDGAGVR